jgi:hypothetical protein
MRVRRAGGFGRDITEDKDLSGTPVLTFSMYTRHT